ncbi:hypothetical protein MRB53_028392 [Persea americana]|uniref:Uncharacterized protein n=1 Tax=Persea americana TaxID=3435 RepID=A0ACC2KFT2_PERAE|nr:hypothetical protein MRB53_028392 [Persea americana]
MPPKRKLYVKPSALTKEKNSYGANRNSNIQRKIPRLNELGAHTLERAPEGPTRHRVSSEDEDDDFNMEYRPSRSEEEFSFSGEDDLEDEVIVLQSTVPERAASQSTEISARACAITDPDLSSAPSTDSSVASTSRRVRGKVVGLAAEKRMKALGVKIV